MDELRRILLLDRIRTVLIIVGCLVVAIGMSCLPLGYHLNPKVDDLFLYVADTGIFLKAGIILIIVGIVTCIIASKIPSLERIKKNKKKNENNQS